MVDVSGQFVSRGGVKLAAALEAFAIAVGGCACADLGCNVGGFTDCLLQRGARRVYAVDTAYGQLAWKLRSDRRVTVLERTNALHFDPWSQVQAFDGCDLVVIDLGWTRQSLALPAALRWLRCGEPAGTGRIVTLIKPHYETGGQIKPDLRSAEGPGSGDSALHQAPDRHHNAAHRARRGVLSDDDAATVTAQVLAGMPSLGVEVLAHIPSPIRGGGGRGRKGNLEYLALLRPARSE